MAIKPKWKEHPLAISGVVELVPTSWIFKIYGTDVSPLADLKDGSLVNLETLWQNLVSEGLYDPVIIRVGIKNKKYRLEAGNHRIQVLHKHNIPFTPAVVQIQEECGPNAPHIMTDASHNFDLPEIIVTKGLAPGFVRPSSVFTELENKIKQL